MTTPGETEGDRGSGTRAMAGTVRRFTPALVRLVSLQPSGCEGAVCHVTEIQHARRVGTELVQRLQVIAPGPHSVDVDPQVQVQVSEALDWSLEQLARTGLVGPANQMASGAFWQAAESWLRYGELQVHARTKPRGYAGDFLLLEKICRCACCPHGIGHAMDHYFQNQAAPAAVRFRTQRVANRLLARCRAISSGTVRVACVGSGPAFELREVAQSVSGTDVSLHVTLIDMDQQALDHAVARLAVWLDHSTVQPVRANLARLERAQSLQRLAGGVDYLYCPGFFDYLDNAAAEQMLCLLSSWLAPGGELTVYNFAPTNTSRCYMEWIGNWYLIYRDTSSLRQLAAALPPELAPQIKSIADCALVELTARRVS